jgi:type I restriction enzyme S subunit
MGELLERNIGGGTPSAGNPDFWGGSIPWLSVGDLSTDACYVETTRKSITQIGLERSSSNLVPFGSLIVAVKISPGKMKLAAREMAINQDLRGLVFMPSVDPKFIYYFFQTIDLSSNGTIVQGITKRYLESIPIPLVSLEIQKQISDALDHMVDLQESLQTEILLRKVQYEFYRDKLLTFKELKAS